MSPHWTKRLELDYEFGRPSSIKVSLFDEIRKKKKSHDKAMGSAVFEVGEVLGSRGNIKAKKLKGGGTLFCRIEPAPEQHAGVFHFSLRGIKLKNVDGLFGKSDPFFEVSRQINSGGGPIWQVVYRSKHIDNNLNPKWEPVSLDMNELCGGDETKTIMITVKDWQKNGKHSPMGFFETSVSGLLSAQTHSGTGDANTIDTTKAFKIARKGKSFGHIAVTKAIVEGGAPPDSSRPTVGAPTTAPSGPASVIPASQPTPPVPVTPVVPLAPPTLPLHQHSTLSMSPLPPPMAPPRKLPKFVDYLSGGLEMQLTVAIDFTGSNGDPRKPGTLHYIHRDGQLNDYEKALSAVGSVVGKYDTDQKFPVVGFGAKYGGVINHCFQVGSKQEAHGVKEIIDAYRQTFRTGLVMSGPTVFAEIISVVASQARSKQEASRRIGKQHYHILLILTDGAVTDVMQTKAAIQAASDAPMSIVIVGIGNADFSTMQFLDDFQSQQGGEQRDICQFVEFERYRHNRMQLTQATLDEIPDQVVSYFHGNAIMPLPPVHGSRMTIVPDEYNDEEEIDLTMNVNEDGEIDLSGAGYRDETTYGTYDTYAQPSAPFVPPPLAHTPSAPFVPQSSGAPTPYVPGGQASPMAGTAAAPPPPPPQHPHTAATAAPVPMFLSVQVPAGAPPGAHIQVQNPTNGQMLFVQIPPGLHPGQSFNVQV